MVVDSSALLAILLAEPDAEVFEEALEAVPERLVSAASVLETSIVVENRYREAGGRELDLLIHRAGIEVASVTAEQVEWARYAARMFGKGRHRAALNFGDCFSYALSKVSGEPLLFKGDDFTRTDIEPVPRP